MLLSAISSAASATVQVCRGSIIQEWGYLAIMTEDGTECIVTRRVGMQTVLDACGAKRCKVTGVVTEYEQPIYLHPVTEYIERLIAVEIDPLQWGTLEPKRLGDPALWQ